MSKLGSLSWVESSGGKINWLERTSILIDAVRARSNSAKRIKSKVKQRHRDVSEIKIPASPFAQAAAAICEKAAEPFLYAHNLRAYYWARLLDDGLEPFDDEAVFVAIMLHDLGLTEQYRLNGEREHCLTIVGARMAQALARQHGWPDERARIAADAITLHLNIKIASCFGKEARMVRAGTAADVAGLGLDVLHRHQIDEVVTLYPRLDFKTRIMGPLQIELHERPRSRISFLQRSLGFGDLIRNARVFAE